MKPFPPPQLSVKRSVPVGHTQPRPLPPSSMRSTVLQSLLLCPDGGVETHRHGQGSTRPRTR
jgi:hypothetical protein